MTEVKELTRQQKRSKRVVYKGRSMRVHDYLVALCKDLDGAVPVEKLNEIYMRHGLEGVSEALTYLKKKVTRRGWQLRIMGWLRIRPKFKIKKV